MEKHNLLKLVINAELEFDEIEKAAAQVPEMVASGSSSCGVELQRADISAGKSVVFVTCSEESAKAFERSLKVAAKGQSISCTPSTAKELYARDIVNA